MKRVEKDGNIMVEIPNFWYKREILKSEPNPNGDLGVQVLKERRIISPVPLNGFKPMFEYADGVRDKVYIGAYEGSLSEDGTKLCSVPDVTVLGSRGVVGFLSLGRANGEGYQIQDYIITTALQWLFLIEYANFDSQACIGRGNVDSTALLSTGLTQGLGNNSGMAVGENGHTSISYRGIENLWGNASAYIVGGFIANFEDNIWYYTNNPENYGNINPSVYTKGFTVTKPNGNMHKIGHNEDKGFIPTTVGNGNSCISDSFMARTGSNMYTVMCHGGGVHIWGGNSAGLFAYRCDYGSGYTNPNIGSRLAYI